MATLVSKAAFAKLHGKSPQAASKWEAKGALVFRDGRVHVELSDQRMAHAGLGRFADPSTAGVNRQPPPSTAAVDVDVPAAAAPPPIERVDLSDPEQLETLSAFVERLLTGRFTDAITAEIVKQNALALKHVLAARKAAGQLIDLETAETTLFEAARTVRAAWMNFPTRIGPLMAAELGIESDRLVEVLSTHVHQQLDDLGEPEASFAGEEQAPEGISSGADAAAPHQHPGVG